MVFPFSLIYALRYAHTHLNVRPMEKTDVFKFTDYRTFLKSHAQEKKEKNPSWTLGMWARNLDLKATTSLTMILNGQRHPGPDIAGKLANYFKFNKKERQYFLDLVLLNKVKNDSRLKVLLMEELKKLTPNKQFQLLDEKTFSVISNWYFYCLRQMTRLAEFHEDSEWIRKQLRFPLTERQVKTALQIMLDLELLKHDSQGRLVISDRGLATTNDLESEALKRFHEQMIENAKLSIRATAVHAREISGLTMPMRKDKIPRAKELLRIFVDEFDKLVGEDGGDSVYQLNIQFFPLAELTGLIEKNKKPTEV